MWAFLFCGVLKRLLRFARNDGMARNAGACPAKAFVATSAQIFLYGRYTLVSFYSKGRKMQINGMSPNFTGFVKFYDSKNGRYTAPVNTSQILGVESGTSKEDGMYVNAVSYTDHEGKVQKILNIHETDENPELPMGEEFTSAVAGVCAEADKTGDILSILV